MIRGVLGMAVASVASASTVDDEVTRGIALAEAGSCEAALELLDVGLRREPEHLFGLRWRGHCRNLIGRYPAALADYGRALALDASDPWTHYARAMSLHNLERFAEAVEGYSAAIELDGSYLEAVQWRAFTRARMGDFAGSLPDYDRALDLAPGDPWTLSSRGRARARVRDFRGAAEDFDGATLVWREDPGTFLALGMARALDGNPRARSALTRALELDPAGHGHAALWRYWIDGDHDHDRAARELGAWRREHSGWEARLADVVLGAAEPGELEPLLLGRPEPEREGLACELDLFAAVTHARAGDEAAAGAAALAALARATRDKWEWEAARLLFRRLNEGRPPAVDVGFDAAGVVTSVGPVAAAAGLAMGDRLAKSDPTELIALVWSSEPGLLVAIDVVRESGTTTVELVVVVAG